MCGRYTITLSAEKIAEIFDLPETKFSSPPRYNVAPTQHVPIIVQAPNPQLMLARWGLVPPWAKDASMGSKMINARAETLAEKASFRQALLNRRCLIPADGFYEWQRQGKGKRPFRITLPDKDVFTFAGLWESWTAPEGTVLNTFTIITTEPSPAIEHIHDRMPAILPCGDLQRRWLAADSISEAADLLGPYTAELNIYAVSSVVNSPGNDTEECIVAITAEAPWLLDTP